MGLTVRHPTSTTHTTARSHPPVTPPALAGRRKRAVVVVADMGTAAAAGFTAAAASDSNCDVVASGLDRAGREVGAAYTACSSGRVLWRYPRNGLRVMLRSPTPGREFRGCIKAAPQFRGARVLVEGDSTLVPVLDPSDGQPLQRVRCFSSYGGQAALFLEAVPPPGGGGGINPHTAAFSYDLQLLPQGQLYHPMQDCRPCSSEDLLSAYCSSDFVASGRLLAVSFDPPTSTLNNFLTPSPLLTPGPGQLSPLQGDLAEEAHLNFAVARILKRPRTKEVRESKQGRENSLDFGEEPEEEVFQLSRGGVVASVAVPPHCGMRAGPGEFILMGRMKLGSPVLTCIPRLSQYRAVVAAAGGAAPCPVEEL